MALPISNDDGTGQESGGQLRARLEEALAQNSALASEVTTLRTQEVLRGGDFDLVKPEDLNGVAPDQVAAKAAEIQQERAALQADLLRKALEKQGFEGDELDDMVASMVAAKSKESEEADATGRIRSLAAVDSKRVPRVNPDDLVGFDAIKAGLDKPAKRS